MGRLKNYFDEELNSTILHAITGIIAGYISFTMNNVGLAFLVMIIILAISMAIVRFMTKSIKKDWKWWFGKIVSTFRMRNED